jgi:2-polyprenyl-6-hydroxyphenyl methylase/3-demethylubiquinone-9 3-methyltransferase
VSEGQQGAALGSRLTEGELRPLDLAKAQAAALARDIAGVQARAAEFIAVPCPACGSYAPEPAFSKYGFRFQRCLDCATLYMSPRPTPAVMADYYRNSENYALWAKHIFPASEQTRREKIHKPWLERVLGYCHRYGVPTGRLIEVGPGFGTFCAVTIETGAFVDIVAVEPTPELAQACRERGVPVIESRIEDVGPTVAPADVVCAFEVIEHLFDPALFVRQCAGLVRPGGLLVLSCPNGQGFDVEMLGASSAAVDNEHVNLFNPGSLSRLLTSCGFAVVECGTPGRLDAELVRSAVLKEDTGVSLDPFLNRVLIDEWDRLGWPFQQFLAANGLSSHMWIAARR